MKDKEVTKVIPVIFQKLNEYDSRFMRVKIWLMHLGENYNGSYFSQEAVQSAIPSLANTPILGYIKENSDGERDFTDHRMVIVREDGDIKVRYIGNAYGVIPQDNNAKFEDRVGDDGVQRTYLTVEGLLWQKWDISTEIMNRDHIKNQSMELHDDYSGQWDDDGLFHFSNFKFFGACILGDGVMPAMNRASVEVEFDQDKLQDHIQEQMEEFKVVFSRYQAENADINNDKEGENMNEKLLELLAKFSLTQETIDAQGFKLEDYTTEEELEAKIAEYAEALNHENTCNTCGKKDCGGHSEKTYTLEEYDALKNELDQVKADFEALKTSKEEVDTQLAEATTRISDFEAIKQEVESLREFKANAEIEIRQAEESELFEQFSEKLTEEDMAPVKDKISEMSIEEASTQLFAILGKKTASFSTKAKKSGIKISVDQKKDQKLDSDYSHILEKHVK